MNFYIYTLHEVAKLVSQRMTIKSLETSHEIVYSRFTFSLEMLHVIYHYLFTVCHPIPKDSLKECV